MDFSGWTDKELHAHLLLHQPDAVLSKTDPDQSKRVRDAVTEELQTRKKAATAVAVSTAKKELEKMPRGDVYKIEKHATQIWATPEDALAWFRQRQDRSNWDIKQLFRLVDQSFGGALRRLVDSSQSPEMRDEHTRLANLLVGKRPVLLLATETSGTESKNLVDFSAWIPLKGLEAHDARLIAAYALNRREVKIQDLFRLYGLTRQVEWTQPTDYLGFRDSSVDDTAELINPALAGVAGAGVHDGLVQISVDTEMLGWAQQQSRRLICCLNRSESCKECAGYGELSFDQACYLYSKGLPPKLFNEWTAETKKDYKKNRAERGLSK